MMKKYKSFILYGIFGVLTTIINILTYFICSKILKLDVITGTIIAFLIAVIFAYVTNRIFVFESKSKNIISEVISFFSCRIGTGVLDILIMAIFVNGFHFNDMLIKVISNIIVIILNYVASKLLVFNNKEKNLKESFVTLFIFILAFIFLMNSPINFLNRGVSGTDSSVFRYFGMMLSRGYTPYLDLFDHKGPILYLINYVGYLIDNISGVWFIEVFFLFISFLFIYKIAGLKMNLFPALLVLLFTTINLFYTFSEGNLVEEYALPFIIISLYIFIDYLLNNKINRLRLILCGLSLGVVSLIRINMISCWVVFAIVVLIKLIREKDYKSLCNYIINFLIGILIIITPIMIWLISRGAFKAFIEDYFLFNFKYSSVSITDKFKSLHFFANNFIIIIATITNLYAIYKEKKKELYIANLIFIILTLIMLSLSGRKYVHYGMMLIPTLIIPFIYFVNLFNKDKEIITIYLLASLIIPNWLNSVASLGLSINHEKNQITDDVIAIKDIIDANTTPSEEISVYGNWDYIYILTNKVSASKYSYQFPIGEVNPKILDDYFQELALNKPRIIVIQKGYKDNLMDEFLNNYNYLELYNKDETFVYKLKD